MKLTEHEAQALVAFELAADMPPGKLARKLRLKEHTLRYALKRLEERRIAIPIPLVSLYRLGLTTYNVFFSLSAQRRVTREAILELFQNTPEIVWVGEFGGEYQYGIAVTAPNPQSLFELLHTLAARYPSAFFAKALSIQRSCTIFPRAYLAPATARALKLSPLRVSSNDWHGGQAESLDELDRSILGELATNGTLSNRQIAGRLKRPASSIDLRMRRLVERGILLKRILAVNPSAFGRQCFKLLVYAKGLNPKLSQALHDFCADQKQVPYLIECLGAWDYEIGLEVVGPEDASAFVQELYERFGAVLNTVTVLTKFKDSKVRWFPG